MKLTSLLTNRKKKKTCVNQIQPSSTHPTLPLFLFRWCTFIAAHVIESRQLVQFLAAAIAARKRKKKTGKSRKERRKEERRSHQSATQKKDLILFFFSLVCFSLPPLFFSS
jgi:DNA-binding FadR family transcriptional regulator